MVASLMGVFVLTTIMDERKFNLPWMDGLINNLVGVDLEIVQQTFDDLLLSIQITFIKLATTFFYSKISQRFLNL